MSRSPARAVPVLAAVALACALLSRAGADEGTASLAIAEGRIAALEKRVARLEALGRQQAAAFEGWTRADWVAAPQPEPGPEAGRVLQAAPGELVLRPRALPAQQAQPWLDDLARARGALQGVSGRFVAAEGGIQFYLEAVDAQGPLASLVGLRPGDRLLSLNGLPFSASEREQTTMWERLRRERRWTLRLVRDEQTLVLTFYLEE